MTKAISQRYTGPDFLKFVCAFLVVGSHTCSILGASKAGYMLFLPITRVAVPLFFMISGFFYAGWSLSRWCLSSAWGLRCLLKK